MANQPIEGGALLDTLSTLLFKGVGKIFSTASEYQKEMGVLKQVSKIPVTDLRGKKSYELTVKLAPIKDKENVYYVEVECPGLKNFNATGIDKQAMTINKSNKGDFVKLVDKIIADNKLRRVNPEQAPDADQFKSIMNPTFAFTSIAEEASEGQQAPAPEDYAITFKVLENASEEDSAYMLRVSSTPALPKKFKDMIEPKAEVEAFVEAIESYVEQCQIEVIEDDEEGYLNFLYAIEELSGEGSEEDLAACTDYRKGAVYVELEKIKGSDGHEDINLVSVSACCGMKSAMDKISMVVASDEFIDRLPEGISSYRIADDDDEFFDVCEW